MTKVNKILIAALAVQVVLAVVLRLGGETTGIPELQPILSDFDAEGVERVVIEETGEDAETLELAREGESWKVASHHGYPAKGEEVKNLLENLAGLKARAPMTTKEKRHAQLGVDAEEYRRRVTIKGADGELVVYIGKSAGPNQTAFRIKGSRETYGVTGLSTSSASPRVTQWVDTSYFSVDEKNIDSLNVLNDQGSFDLLRTDDGGWEVLENGEPAEPPEGEVVNTPHVKELLGKISSITLSEPAGSKELDQPTTVTLRMKSEESESEGESSAVSGEQIHLDITPADEEGKLYVHERQSRPVLVNKSALEPLLKLDRGALFATEEEVEKAKKKNARPPGGGMRGMPGGGGQIPPSIRRQLQQRAQGR